MDDFDDLDKISFKPVTKGLGFHNDKKEKPIKRQKVKTAPSKEYQEIVNPTPVQSTSFDNETVSRDDLSMFYGAQPSNTTEEITPQEEKSVEVLAPTFKRFIAWFIDVLLVGIFWGVTVASFAIYSKVHMASILQVVTISELGVFTASLFLLFYLLYFTVLDMSVTPGKAMMGVQLVSEDGEKVRAGQTFTCSLVTLLSVVFLFFPVLVDFHGKASGTKVILSE